VRSASAGSRIGQLARGFQAASNGEARLRVDDLAALVHREQPINGGLVAHWDIAALFEPVRDDSPVFTVAHPRPDTTSPTAKLGLFDARSDPR
jgi:hypothetical protein